MPYDRLVFCEELSSTQRYLYTRDEFLIILRRFLDYLVSEERYLLSSGVPRIKNPTNHPFMFGAEFLYPLRDLEKDDLTIDSNPLFKLKRSFISLAIDLFDVQNVEDIHKKTCELFSHHLPDTLFREFIELDNLFHERQAYFKRARGPGGLTNLLEMIVCITNEIARQHYSQIVDIFGLRRTTANIEAPMTLPDLSSFGNDKIIKAYQLNQRADDEFYSDWEKLLTLLRERYPDCSQYVSPSWITVSNMREAATSYRSEIEHTVDGNYHFRNWTFSNLFRKASFSGIHQYDFTPKQANVIKYLFLDATHFTASNAEILENTFDPPSESKNVKEAAFKQGGQKKLHPVWGKLIKPDTSNRPGSRGMILLDLSYTPGQED